MSTPAERKVIRLGQREYEFGSQAHLDAIEAEHNAKLAELQRKLEETQGKLDAAERAVQAAKREKEEEEQRNEEEEKERQRSLTKRVKARVRLLMRAIRLFGEDGDDEDDEKKMDALAEMDERDIHIKAIQKFEPDFKADGLSDDFIAGKFEGVVKYQTRARGIDSVVRAAGGPRLDARESVGASSRAEHPVAKARREHYERMNNIAFASAREGGAR